YPSPEIEAEDSQCGRVHQASALLASTAGTDSPVDRLQGRAGWCGILFRPGGPSGHTPILQGALDDRPRSRDILRPGGATAGETRFRGDDRTAAADHTPGVVASGRYRGGDCPACRVLDHDAV